MQLSSMSSSETELIHRHQRILRQRVKQFNEENGTSYRLGPNIDLLFYLKYIKFIQQLKEKAGNIAAIEGSSEVMNQHWIEASDELFAELTND